MPEEAKQNKKPAIIKRIFKWIGLGLLALLLVAGIIFQAPWKVITLLVIILLACAVLPRPARKWFWLSVGAIVIALLIWVFLPDENGDWRPYTFDEELAALEAKYAIPDEENAATIYNKLLESYDANEFSLTLLGTDFYDSIYSGPWLSEDFPEAAGWLERHEGTIVTLIEASRIEECRFPISDPANIKPQIDRNAAIKRWAYLLVIAANNDVAEARIDQALKKQIALLQMSKHLYQQPTPIDLMVGIAMEALAIHQFNRLVVTSEATEENLILIEEAIAAIGDEWGCNWPKIAEYEKLTAKSTLAKFYEINSKGRIRLSRDPSAEIRACLKRELEANKIENRQIKEILESRVYLTYWQRKFIRAKTILYWFYMPSSPHRTAKIIETSFEKYYSMAEPDFDWKKEPAKAHITSLLSIPARLNYRRLIERMTGMSEEIYYRIHDYYLRVASEQRGSRIIITLRRYKNKNGQWPKSLDEIKSLAPTEIFVDPINGGSFVYKLTEENFSFYSKGKNNIDENGWHRDGCDDSPIWPRIAHKAKKENTDVE